MTPKPNSIAAIAHPLAEYLNNQDRTNPGRKISIIGGQHDDERHHAALNFQRDRRPRLPRFEDFDSPGAMSYEQIINNILQQTSNHGPIRFWSRGDAGIVRGSNFSLGFTIYLKTENVDFDDVAARRQISLTVALLKASSDGRQNRIESAKSEPVEPPDDLPFDLKDLMRSPEFQRKLVIEMLTAAYPQKGWDATGVPVKTETAASTALARRLPYTNFPRPERSGQVIAIQMRLFDFLEQELGPTPDRADIEEIVWTLQQMVHIVREQGVA